MELLAKAAVVFRSCVRMWFGQRGRDILWKMEGMSGLV